MGKRRTKICKLICFKKFLKKYSIDMYCPIYENASSIKYKLMQIGLSNKPLEGSTLFGNTFSKASNEVASNEVIKNYIERKLPVAHENIKFLCQDDSLLAYK